MTNRTTLPANAMPVYLAPAPNALTKNFAAAVAAFEVLDAPGFVAGLVVNTGAAGSIELFDGDPGAGGVSIGKWSTASAGPFLPLSLPFADALFATVVGTANVSITYARSAI